MRLPPAVFTVTAPDDSGPGSLRQAIMDANGTTEANTITFDIGGGGVQAIRLNSDLPTITRPVTVDGTTQPGYAGTPLIELFGQSYGLRITAGSSMVRGLVINDARQSAISLEGMGNNVIAGNFIGTDATGLVAMRNATGISISSAPNNTIGGTTPEARNLITSSQQANIAISGSRAADNVIQGNLIGTDLTGTHIFDTPYTNAVGITVTSAGNTTIGGTVAGARNLIAGKWAAGVDLLYDEGALIEGNYIGTDITGSRGLGQGVGVEAAGANDIIGGTAPGACNVVSGIAVGGSSDLVQGNYIGLDVSGSHALGNGTGVVVDGTGDTLGGTAAGAGNVISGNQYAGVDLSETEFSAPNVVEGNFIGTDPSGTVAVPNQVGVIGEGTVGGTMPGAGNLISGNAQYGIIASSAVVLGNLIGTDITGTTALGNGVGIYTRETGVLIGGTDAGAGNVISGNRAEGILVETGSDVIQGNFIGTDLTGTRALPNLIGVRLVTGSNNTIGGTTAEARNLISGNRAEGILAENGGAEVEGNYIGTDVNGTQAVGNQTGISQQGAAALHIGGTLPGAGNVISGNWGDGIFLETEIVEGNLIGTDASGTAALGNGGNGITLQGGDNIIGGTTPGAGNLISGNQLAGVSIEHGGGQLIEGNFIGTDISGTQALGNGQGVVDEVPRSMNVTFTDIGGTVAGASNLISGNRGAGIYLEDRAVFVLGNSIGTDVTGTIALGNGGDGIDVAADATLITVGSQSMTGRNVIAGNGGDGIRLENTGTVVKGNYIGMDGSGAVALPNHEGITVADGATGTTIGGTTAAAQNVISGNADFGVVVEAGAMNTLIEANFIGTDATGTTAVGNQVGGILIEGQQTTVGGTVAGTGNLISGNGDNLVISGNQTQGSLVEGNFIGTDVTGTLALGNAPLGGGNGVVIQSSESFSTIGGTVPGAGNLISGNRAHGLLATIFEFVAIEGNFIGTDISGSQALGNGSDGVAFLDQAQASIGGTVSGARNVISGNAGFGILFDLGQGDVLGNYIGTDVTGTAAVGNGRGGISISTPTTFAPTVGGTVPGAGNVISGNIGDGIFITSMNQIGNITVQGNWIGTDITGLAPLANAGNGITIFRGSGTLIGGTVSGAGNTIAFNAGDGVLVDTDPGAFLNNPLIQENSIFGHSSGLGIELLNGTFLAAPVLTSAVFQNGTLTLRGMLPSTVFAITTVEFFANEVCNPSGYGEGQRFLGFVNVPSGQSGFTATLTVAVDAGQFISATVSDPRLDGDGTSSFAGCVPVTSMGAAGTDSSSRYDRLVAGMIPDQRGTGEFQGLERAAFGRESRDRTNERAGWSPSSLADSPGVYVGPGGAGTAPAFVPGRQRLRPVTVTWLRCQAQESELALDLLRSCMFAAC